MSEHSVVNAAPLDLECHGLSRDFDGVTAVDNISLGIEPGSFFSILGPSGCGKTTLLRLFAGFLEPSRGDILIKGRSMLGVPPNKRPVNMVFQQLALFPTMNVRENVGYGLRRKGVKRAELNRLVERMIERVGLPAETDKSIDQLSGGQKQRVALARCLIMEPDVLLLDEPLSALDLKLRERMKVELKQLQHEFGTTFVYITHDQSEALLMSDRVAVMNRGKFEQVGAPSTLYFEPQSAFVAGFVGDSNRQQGRIRSAQNGRLVLETLTGTRLQGIDAANSGLKAGEQVEIFIRPESIKLSRSPLQDGAGVNQLSGSIHSLLFNGANSRVLVREENHSALYTAVVPQTGEYADLRANTPLHISWPTEQVRCYRQQPAGEGGG